jgi:hypothetical protein
LRFCLLTGTDPYELFGAAAEEPVAHIHH